MLRWNLRERVAFYFCLSFCAGGYGNSIVFDRETDVEVERKREKKAAQDFTDFRPCA